MKKAIWILPSLMLVASCGKRPAPFKGGTENRPLTHEADELRGSGSEAPAPVAPPPAPSPEPRGSGTSPDPPAPPAKRSQGSATGPEKMVTIARGTAYRKEDYLIPGHVVILEFTADW